MLQDIRDRAQGMIAKFIIGFICLTFALFGVDALFGISDPSKPVAEVNGEEIDERELNRALDLRKRRIVAQMGDRLDPSMLDDPALRRSVLEEMIERQLMLQQARDMGMEFSAEQVERVLLEIEDFKLDGRFSQDMFERAVRAQGMSPAMFRDIMREEMMIAQLQFGIGQSGFVTTAELERAARLEGQTRDIAWLTVSAAEQGKALQFEESELKQHYEKNRDDFMQPERVRVAFVEISQEKLAESIVIGEEALRAAYEQEVATLQAGEERKASHLLLQVGDDADGEAVRQKAESIRAEIAAGLDFSEAVAKYSEDAGSRASGGELGWVARGAFGEKFDEGLFALATGEVSAPVRTGFGYHLLKVTEIRAADPPAFEEMREALETRLKRDRAVQEYAEKVEELGALAFESGDLQEPAQALNLEIRETGFFDREGVTGDGSEKYADLVASNRFRDHAFSDEVLEDGLNSDVFEPEDGRAFVVRVRERQAARPLPFESVRGRIITSLRQERGAKKAAALGKQLFKELKEGGSAGSIAAREALAWQNRDKVRRGAQDVPPRVLQRAFALQRPAGEGKSMDALKLVNGDYVIVVVSGVHEGKPLDKYTNSEIARLRAFHANVRGALQFAGIQNTLEKDASVKKF